MAAEQSTALWMRIRGRILIAGPLAVANASSAQSRLHSFRQLAVDRAVRICVVMAAKRLRQQANRYSTVFSWPTECGLDCGSKGGEDTRHRLWFSGRACLWPARGNEERLSKEVILPWFYAVLILLNLVHVSLSAIQIPSF